jgi:transposase
MRQPSLDLTPLQGMNGESKAARPWFERQMFGSKSERLSVLQNSQQLSLTEPDPLQTKAGKDKARTVSAHVRHVKPDLVREAESVPFFDETRVPVQIIQVPNPQI